MVNISFLEVPLYEGKKIINTKLKDAMYLTAEPLYKNIQIPFEELHLITRSDYRQYSPFIFKDGKKISENWNNESQNLIILDIDDGLTINEAKEYFKQYKYFLCTTKSHRVAKKGFTCDRYRIILQSNNIPRGEEYFNLMRILEKKFSFIDKQVNTKTGAFLSHFDCEYWYNNGSLFDCDEYLKIAKKLSDAKVTPPVKQREYKENKEDIDTEKIKSMLSREVIADIVTSCGYPVNRNFKFKYREDERTPSASIRVDGLIKDFGSDLSTDVIGFVQTVKSLSFKESVDYVRNFT